MPQYAISISTSCGPTSRRTNSKGPNLASFVCVANPRVAIPCLSGALIELVSFGDKFTPKLVKGYCESNQGVGHCQLTLRIDKLIIRTNLVKASHFALHNCDCGWCTRVPHFL